ncbi:TonB-dependent siderophore receptor [Chelatococcus sambhunathii]|uniref:TonB-dependent siderophore receptor n=1 Tax=Chelatococcus sambhunathii TaxID=363953 RepID=A0ABP2A530_9HYPH|nr:TonB-dependent siderophore receptor [Chelatococcus sambhunathii]CUA87629.1 TonB-dependent siderophore receptor [Chelatococcus sambhunathii]
MGRRVSGAEARDVQRLCGRAAWLTATAMALIIAGPAMAQTIQSTGQASNARQAGSARAFDIPAQPLSRALAAFGRQAGLQVSAAADAVADFDSPAVRGTMSAEAALRRLLANTGASFRIAGGTVTVSRGAAGAAAPAADGSILLDTINIEGTAETAYGPVDGYVATRTGTGAKTDTPVIEVPQSISVITRDRIEAQKAQTLPEALRYTPGVLAQPWGLDPRFDQFKVRGFEITSVGVYRDGMRMPTVGMMSWAYDPYGVERIDVLRGPSSVLYGAASPGGIVNLVTKRPPASPFHEVEISGGSDANKQINADLGGPIDKDGIWSYRITGLLRDSETQVDYTRNDRHFIAPALTWRPSADTSLTLFGSYQHDEASAYGTLPALGTRFANPNGRIARSFFIGDPNFDRVDRTAYSLGYAFEHRFNGAWTVRQNLRWGHLEADQKVLYGAGLRADLRTLDRAAFTVDGKLRSFTVDNQVEGKFETGPLQHTLLFGLDYLNLSARSLQGYSDSTYDPGVPPIDLFQPIYGQAVALPPIYQNNEQTLSQLGLYAQDQIKSGGFILTAGLRQDWATSKLKNYIANSSRTQDDNELTWRVGLGYEFDFGLVPYAAYATSFEPVVGTDRLGAAYKPTTGEQFEVGLKYQPPGMRSMVTLALFDLKQQNVLTTDPLNPFFSVQTGEIHTRGLEVEALASLMDGLDLVASYTYTDAEISKDTDAALVGNTPAVTPRHMASLWLDYTLQEGVLKGLGLGGGVRYVGASYADNANTFQNQAFTLVDAAVHYERDNWRFAVNAKNLFDKTYVICNGGDLSCVYGPGRSVVASLRYRW